MIAVSKHHVEGSSGLKIWLLALCCAGMLFALPAMYVGAKDDREGCDPQQFTFGPGIQVYLKLLVRLKRATIFDLDDSKSRPLVLGERIPNYYRAWIHPQKSGAVESATAHFPLFAGILLTERSGSISIVRIMYLLIGTVQKLY